jgi:hypothetical protein
MKEIEEEYGSIFSGMLYHGAGEVNDLLINHYLINSTNFSQE